MSNSTRTITGAITAAAVLAGCTDTGQLGDRFVKPTKPHNSEKVCEDVTVTANPDMVGKSSFSTAMGVFRTSAGGVFTYLSEETVNEPYEGPPAIGIVSNNDPNSISDEIWGEELLANMPRGAWIEGGLTLKFTDVRKDEGKISVIINGNKTDIDVANLSYGSSEDLGTTVQGVDQFITAFSVSSLGQAQNGPSFGFSVSGKLCHYEKQEDNDNDRPSSPSPSVDNDREKPREQEERGGTGRRLNNDARSASLSGSAEQTSYSTPNIA